MMISQVSISGVQYSAPAGAAGEEARGRAETGAPPHSAVHRLLRDCRGPAGYRKGTNGVSTDGVTAN